MGKLKKQIDKIYNKCYSFNIYCEIILIKNKGGIVIMREKKCLVGRKKTIVVVAAIVCVLLVGTGVLATSKTFSKAFVDNNQWTSIVSAKERQNVWFLFSYCR